MKPNLHFQGSRNCDRSFEDLFHLMKIILTDVVLKMQYYFLSGHRDSEKYHSCLPHLLRPLQFLIVVTVRGLFGVFVGSSLRKLAALVLCGLLFLPYMPVYTTLTHTMHKVRSFKTLIHNTCHFGFVREILGCDRWEKKVGPGTEGKGTRSYRTPRKPRSCWTGNRSVRNAGRGGALREVELFHTESSGLHEVSTIGIRSPWQSFRNHSYLNSRKLMFLLGCLHITASVTDQIKREVGTTPS